MPNQQQVYIIAEIGTNHGGQLQRAKDLIRACADAGANAVKFQTWQADQLRNPWDFDAQGQRSRAGVVDILEPLTTRYEWHQALVDCCKQHGVDFLSTPFDLDSARLLHSLDTPAIKIASGDITFYELIKEVGSYGLPVILSTGMANEAEIAQALEWLGPAAAHTTLLHCISAYPAAIEDANLKAITSLHKRFQLPVGLSDHFMEDDPAIAAVALGATVLEKHITFSRNDGFPDSPFAHEIDDLRRLVQRVRALESGLGDGVIGCRDSEAGGLSGGRRGIYLACDLSAGTTIERQHLRVARPDLGQCQPVDVPQVVGCTLAHDKTEGQALHWGDLTQ